MAITQREAFAQVMEHLVTHDGGSGHGYSQYNRMGDGTTEAIRLSDGTTVTIAGGDRDCSSAVITALRAVGINTFGATYTGNMREQLLKTGLFGWRKMGVKSAQRGDIYLNEKHHTAVCISPYGSMRGDLLAQFSISEREASPAPRATKTPTSPISRRTTVIRGTALSTGSTTARRCPAPTPRLPITPMPISVTCAIGVPSSRARFKSSSAPLLTA